MELVSKITQGDQSALAKGITLLESSLEKDLLDAQNLVSKCLPISGNSIRIGITGVPGVGKSTFIDVFGKLLTKKGHKVAVLAIDPTSNKTRGSILGDKSRMNQLSVDKNAFIRPSPSSGTLGGVANKTKESIILCEAAGYDVILIETVGVGQSETTVSNLTDFFLLLMLAGAGDELQGIKRGIMEQADYIIINKADGDNITNANNAALTYKRSIHLFPPMENGWVPQVSICSAIENTGIDKVYETINTYNAQMNSNGWKEHNREQQEIYWLHEKIKEEFGKKEYNNLISNKKIQLLEKDLKSGKKLYEIIKDL